MRKIVITSVALSAVLITGGAVVAEAATASTAKATHPQYEKLSVVEHAVTDTTADTGPKGDSLGDVLAFANPIFGRANKHRIGSDNGSCIRTKKGTAYDCEWTLTLRTGQLMVQGPFYDSRNSELAITGGTGSFVGATGQMLLHARNAKGTAYDFVYRVKK